ncbi:peptide ABC transporter substrate-binding protein [Telmatospirillum siberiense]|nr:peptide ABC transporter substrate-binding protein [Telmatospirillum siberiense]
MPMKRAVLAMGVILAFLSVGSSSYAGGEVVLRRGNAAEPESLDPARSDTVNAGRIQDDLFEGLVVLDPEDRPLPGAAESWTVSADGLTYSFTLRAGLSWSDGSPLTAEDFVYSFRRVVDPATASSYAYIFFAFQNAEEIVQGKIKDPSRLGVEAVDPRTLRIHLKRPTPYLLAELAHAKFMPVKKANVEKFGAAFTQPGNLVSNGAFILEEWTPQARVVLAKNPKYWDAANVHIDKVIFYPITSPNEELNRYRAGELDITYAVPNAQAESLRKTAGEEFRSNVQFESSYLGFNLTKPPFAGNPKLRQALSMTIDREMLAEKLLKVGSIPAYGIVPPVGDPAYKAQRVSWASLSQAERVAKAKILYAEAGYGPDHPLSVELRLTTSEDARKVAIAIASMWQTALGVKTSLVTEEFKMLVAHRHEKQVTQVFADAWVGDYPDATTFLDLFTTGSGENDPGYANPKFDALIAEAGKTLDTARRAELLQQAETLLLEDAAIAPTFNHVELFLAKPYVKNYRPNPCGYTYSKAVTILPH